MRAAASAASDLPVPLPEEAAVLAPLDLDALRELNPEVAGWLPIPGPDGRILTLSTCTGRGHATRWVVQAVLAGTYKR